MKARSLPALRLLAACCGRRSAWAAGLLATALSALGAPTVYRIDPEHTYPSFEADHMGLSVWRGKFNKSSGTVVLDKAAGQGSLEVRIDVDSIDFGNERMNEVARGSEMFDVARYPQATYVGKLEGFGGGLPSRVAGELTLHGVTRPVPLVIGAFKCAPHPLLRVREVCGADASGSFRRDEFGVDAGKLFGFNMDVTLRIQVEAIEEDALRPERR